MASPDEHGMAAQQEAAKGYQPTLDVSYHSANAKSPSPATQYC